MSDSDKAAAVSGDSEKVDRSPGPDDQSTTNESSMEQARITDIGQNIEDKNEKDCYDSTSTKGSSTNDLETTQEQIVGDADKEATPDPKVERRVLWKIDGIVCTVLAAIYTLQYMDKVSTSSASIMGFREDLNMHGQMYSWTGSAFYLGYLGFQFVCGNLILQRLHIGIASGVLIILFGLFVACMGAVHNFRDYTALRVLQGFGEGSITPTFVLLTSQWYKRDEQFGRTSAWFAGVGIGNILVDALGYGLITTKSPPMAPWRLVFIILGVATVGVGVIYIAFIPSTPAKAWFLTAEERIVAVERTRENQNCIHDSRIKLYQITEAVFKDLRTWIYIAIVVLSNIPNGGITNFNTIIIRNMGYSVSDSLLMDMPAGALQLFGQLAMTFLSERFFQNKRMVWVISSACINVMALCFLAFGSDELGLAGYYIWAIASPICYVGVLSFIASNSAGHSKKAFTSSLVMAGYSVGNIIGSQTFKESEAPDYPTAKTTMVGCVAAVLVLCIFLLWFNIFVNRRRDRKNEKLPSDGPDAQFLDLTDLENPEFRYAI